MLELLKKKYNRIHFIGIGGIGMSGIAKYLIKKGFKISGSDLVKSEITTHLENLGADIYIGQTADNIKDQELVVYSSAVHGDNPELSEAISKGIKCVKRSVILGELTKTGITIGVAGTHGKTSTTAMLGILLMKAGMNPTVFVGGVIKEFDNTNVVVGSGDYIVVEADEYDRTFHNLYPAYALVNNIEAEHLDIYENYDDVRKAFVQYINKIPFYGKAAINIDNAGSKSIIADVNCDFVTYGINNIDADFRAENIEQTNSGMRFDLICKDRIIKNVELGVYGEHNITNAIASIAMAVELGVDDEIIKTGLKNFKGAERRFQILFDGEVKVIDDYAHHPSEVKVSLQTAQKFGGRVVAVFQPHLYSRTKDFYKQFADVFSQNTNLIFCLDVYPAREKPIEGVTGKMIIDEIDDKSIEKYFIENSDDLFAQMKSKIRKNDVILFMGAGSITKLAHKFAEMLSAGEMKF